MALVTPMGATAQSQLVWEDEYGSGATAGPVTIDGTMVTVSNFDPFGIGSPGNATVNYGVRGAHAGYWEAGMNATNRSQFLTMSLTFSQPVEALAFSMLDIDTNNLFHDSISVVGWSGNTPFTPTTTFLGAAVAEVVPGVYSGQFNVDNNSTAANVGLRFDQPLDSVTFSYGPGPNASANPDLQVMGLSDLSWTLPCLSTLVVSTTAELRAAVANPCVTLILMNPGTYALSASGSGQLDIGADKTLRNVGGGEVIIDAVGASRVIEVRNGATVELDGLTITGGSSGNGGGIFTRGDLTVRNSTVTGNSANNGAGVFHRSGNLLMENVTVSGNTASRDGGGLDIRAGAQLTHVTIANNSARRGAGLRSRNSSATITNTLIADNQNNSGGEIRGNITSVGINLVEGGCSGCSGGDLTGDPGLLPLASNGGDSRTHALGAGSIALDAASPAFGLSTDQRGVGRPSGPGYDIGAYEAALSVAVTVLADSSAASRLPSNGTGYTESFTVTNSGASASAYDLEATATGSAAIVDSIRGPGVTWGARPDSALTSVLAGNGGSTSILVFYSVPDAAAGTSEPLGLTGTSVSAGSVSDTDATTGTIVRPFLGMTKIASVAGDTVPGAAITYQMTVTNLGTEAAAQVELLDSLPPMVDYLVGSASETLPAGIAATLEFDDGSGAWTYTPVSLGCGGPAGFDRCVRAVRWSLDTPLPAAAPDNAAVFTLVAGIR